MTLCLPLFLAVFALGTAHTAFAQSKPERQSKAAKPTQAASPATEPSTDKKPATDDDSGKPEDKLFKGMKYRLIGPFRGGRSLTALMLSEKISSTTALDWGLAHSVVPAAEVMREAVAVARRLASGPTCAIRSLRSLHASAFTATIQDYLAKEKWIQMDSVGNGECVEGVRAFFGRRDPVFHKQAVR